MLELITPLWATAIFFALAGALHGWQREVKATGGCVIGLFAILQFDSLLRGSIYSVLTNELTFTLQTLLYLGIVYAAYRARTNRREGDTARSIRGSLMGAAVGFFNGYVVAGSIWYFLDINRYPFAQLISAPADTSASFQGLGLMPVVLLGGGLAANGALFAVVALAILAAVMLAT